MLLTGVLLKNIIKVQELVIVWCKRGIEQSSFSHPNILLRPHLCLGVRKMNVEYSNFVLLAIELEDV